MTRANDDTYIPPKQDRTVLTQKLRRLPVISLCKLIIAWVDRFAVRRREANVAAIKEYLALELKKKKKIGRPELAAMVVTKYWSKGLNLFQLAELDTRVLLQHPKSYVWNCHTIYEAENDKYSALIQPNEFSESLRSLLQLQGQLSHIYHKRHDSLPLNIFRVQLYDISRNDQHVTQRLPFYIATTISKSPVIFHSDYRESDIYAKLIMQLVKETLLISEKSNFRNPQTIKSGKSSTYLTLKDDGPAAMKNLESIVKLASVDGTGNAIAAWSAYSTGTADTTPLTDGTNHQSAAGRDTIPSTTDPLELKKKSMLRFKGRQYSGNDEYDSEIPVEKVSFTIRNFVKKLPGIHQLSIKLKLSGKDVFGGLHELCDKGMLDVDHIHGWICGENGNKSGTVSNDDFREYRNNGGLI